MISIYIHSLASEKIGVVEEQGKITEVVIDRPEIQQQVGNIYLGKIINIEKGLQAAFVQIEGKQLGFLSRKELPEARKEKDKPIEQIVTEGQTILVQVKKDAYGTKGAFLTANITLPGMNVIYLPFGGYVAVSKKIEEPVRTQLKEQAESWLCDEEGLILRTTAATMNALELQEEYEALRQKWMVMEKTSRKTNGPAVLFQDYLIPDRLVRKFPPESIQTVFVNNTETAVNLRETYVHLKEKVAWQRDLENIMPFSTNQLLEKLVNRRVPAANGIELVIEHTEAMTVIDVNTAAYRGKNDKQQTIVHTNLHAAQAVAEQLRLRNISGMILVDFVSMKTEAERKQVIKKLKAELVKDSVRTEVYGFTQLGLLEMTRKRESPSLPYLLLQEKQAAFSPETAAYMLEREIIHFQSSKREAALIEINPDVYTAFRQLVSKGSWKGNITKEIYFLPTDSIDTYDVSVSGSSTLVNEQVARKDANSIDNLF